MSPGPRPSPAAISWMRRRRAARAISMSDFMEENLRDSDRLAPHVAPVVSERGVEPRGLAQHAAQERRRQHAAHVGTDVAETSQEQEIEGDPAEGDVGALRAHSI